MAEESSYRAVVLAVSIAAAAVAGYHRLRARRADERISHREEGWPTFVSIRLCGLVMELGLLAYAFFPQWTAWAALPIPVPLRWIGAAVAFSGVPFLLWVLRSLGKNLTDTVVTRREATLVVHGPYRLVRHPFYMALLWLMTGVSLASASGWIAAAGVATWVLLAIRSIREEHFLREKFGDAYLEYAKTTGRFFPRFR
jgi:protein-S-isoprenylcysteine O-methyltransferase Ste14